MRGKFTKMELTSYSNAEKVIKKNGHDRNTLYFVKTIHTDDKKIILACFDFTRNEKFFKNYPYLIEGFSYDFYGEFEMYRKGEDMVGKRSRTTMNFEITKIDDITINS